MISLEYARIYFELLAVSGSADSIEPGRAGEMTPGACSGIALLEYVSKLEEIALLMKQYQTLVDKDVAAMMTAGKQIVQADLALSK